MSGVLITNVAWKGEVIDLRLQDHVTASPAGADDATRVIDGTGLLVVPAFSDYHVHFRDPGLTEKEDVLTGARAAAAGGYADVVCMPNTRPVIDAEDAIDAFTARVTALGIPIAVRTSAAVTRGQHSRELTEIAAIYNDFAAFLFTDDGEPIVDEALLATALRQTAQVDGVIMIALHCEVTPRSRERVEATLGAGPDMRREPELICLGLRALEQAGMGELRIQHVSLAESVDIIADAKRRGLAVSAEVAPHHLLFCADDIPQRGDGLDANWKMNPPLRSREDMLAMRRALADGTIDVIATDHAPHTVAEKARPWDDAPFGVIGLETAFSACYALVRQGELTFDRLIDALTRGEYAKMQNLNRLWWKGVTLIDPNHTWTVDPDTFYSKGRNCPFAGMTFTGRPVYTIGPRGKLVMAEGDVLF